MTAVWRATLTEQRYFPRPSIHLSDLLFSSAPSIRQISIDLLINLFIHLSITPHWACASQQCCYRAFVASWKVLPWSDAVMVRQHLLCCAVFVLMFLCALYRGHLSIKQSGTVLSWFFSWFGLQWCVLVIIIFIPWQSLFCNFRLSICWCELLSNHADAD